MAKLDEVRAYLQRGAEACDAIESLLADTNCADDWYTGESLDGECINFYRYGGCEHASPKPLARALGDSWFVQGRDWVSAIKGDNDWMVRIVDAVPPFPIQTVDLSEEPTK